MVHREVMHREMNPSSFLSLAILFSQIITQLMFNLTVDFQMLNFKRSKMHTLDINVFSLWETLVKNV